MDVAYLNSIVNSIIFIQNIHFVDYNINIMYLLFIKYFYCYLYKLCLTYYKMNNNEIPAASL